MWMTVAVAPAVVPVSEFPHPAPPLPSCTLDSAPRRGTAAPGDRPSQSV